MRVGNALREARTRPVARAAFLSLVIALGLASCVDQEPVSPELTLSDVRAADTRKISEGREIFRFDDFGNWRFWTDTLELNDAVETLTPNQALALGLKVDADAIPAEVLQAVLADPALLDDPATTRALLGLDAVVGVVATVGR